VQSLRFVSNRQLREDQTDTKATISKQTLFVLKFIRRKFITATSENVKTFNNILTAYTLTKNNWIKSKKSGYFVMPSDNHLNKTWLNCSPISSLLKDWLLMFRIANRILRLKMTNSFISKNLRTHSFQRHQKKFKQTQKNVAALNSVHTSNQKKNIFCRFYFDNATAIQICKHDSFAVKINFFCVRQYLDALLKHVKPPNRLMTKWIIH